MSLIGPRPEVPEYVSLDDPLWQGVLRTRPGITDLASLAFRNEEELLGAAADPNGFYRGVLLPAKLRLNLQFQQSRSFLGDLKLLWMTGWHSFFSRAIDPNRVMRMFGAEECGLALIKETRTTIHA
jgi:lipopolysaccharide/colanic/teichoic acid biosynthesis glycosyltransferase